MEEIKIKLLARFVDMWHPVSQSFRRKILALDSVKEDEVLLIELISVHLVHAELLVDSLSLHVVKLNIQSDALDQRVSLCSLDNVSVQGSEDTFAACLSIYID